MCRCSLTFSKLPATAPSISFPLPLGASLLPDAVEDPADRRLQRRGGYLREPVKLVLVPLEVGRERNTGSLRRLQKRREMRADVSAIAEDRLVEETVETSGDDCSIVLVGKSDLAGRIDEHPRVRDRFFAGDDPKARVAYLSAAKADRDLASTLRGDLQRNLRLQVGQGWNVTWHDPVGDQGLAEVPEAAS